MTRCLGLCPRKALAVVGDGLPAMAAVLRDAGDLAELARYAGSAPA